MATELVRLRRLSKVHSQRSVKREAATVARWYKAKCWSTYDYPIQSRKNFAATVIMH